MGYFMNLVRIQLILYLVWRQSKLCPIDVGILSWRMETDGLQIIFANQLFNCILNTILHSTFGNAQLCKLHQQNRIFITV